MLQEVILPRLGQTVEKATIEKWYVKEGDIVKKGDILLEITTDKATLEIESFVEGTLLKTYVEAGEEIDVDAVIAYVGDPEKEQAPESPPELAKPEPSEKAPERLAETAPPHGLEGRQAAQPAAAGKLLISPRARKTAERKKVTPLAVRGTGPHGRVVEADVIAYAERVAQLRVSPTAREVAYERGVDLLQVEGTGDGGRVMKADVEKARPLAPAAAAGTKKVELTAAKRIIGERMARSKQEVPHFYLQTDIDMTEAVALREELKAAGTAVSFNDIIIKAVARGFEAVPMMNASWAGDCIAVNSTADVALAVATDEGLMVPVVRGVERQSLKQVAAHTAELIHKARSKRLTPLEYEGGGITVSNLGMYQVGNFLPIINPGQASILGVGQIADKPVVINGKIAARKMMAVTLAVDHRVADGVVASAFLQAVKNAMKSARHSLREMEYVE